MAKFLLPSGTGVAEQMYEIVLGMKKDNQQVSLFRKKPEVYRTIREIASKYKDRIPDYYHRLRQIRKLKIFVHRSKDEDCQAEAFLDDAEIHIYKCYFQYNKATRLATLEHELTHIIQGLFERKRGKKLSKSPYRKKKELKYQHDFYEEETLSKDIYYEILEQRGKGKLRSERSVANFIREHKDFKEFKSGTKRRKFKKIMTHVFTKTT